MAEILDLGVIKWLVSKVLNTLFLILSLLEILAERLQKSISVEFNLLIVLDFNSHVSAPL